MPFIALRFGSPLSRLTFSDDLTLNCPSGCRLAPAVVENRARRAPVTGGFGGQGHETWSARAQLLYHAGRDVFVGGHVRGGLWCSWMAVQIASRVTLKEVEAARRQPPAENLIEPFDAGLAPGVSGRHAHGLSQACVISSASAGDVGTGPSGRKTSDAIGALLQSAVDTEG